MLNYFILFVSVLFSSGFVAAQSLSQDTTQAFALRAKALIEYDLGRFVAGNQCLRQAAALYSKHQLWELYVECQTPLISRFARRRDLDSSLQVLAHLSETSQRHFKNSLAEATFYLSASEGFYWSNNLEQALGCLDSAMWIGKPFLTDKNAFSATCYLRQAQIAYRQQQYDKSVELALKARRIFRSLPSEKFSDILGVTDLLMHDYIEMEANKKSLIEAEYLLTMSKKYFPSTHKIVGESYSTAGIAYSSIGNMPKAFEYMGQAEQIFRGLLSDSLSLGILLSNIGVTYKDYIYQMRADNPELASRFLDTAEMKLLEGIKIERAVLGNKHPILSGAYRGLGYVYYERPNHARMEDALACFNLGMLALLPNDTSSNVDYIPDFNNPQTTYLDIISLFWIIDAKINAYRGLYEKTKDAKYLKLANQHIDAINVLLEKRLQTSNSPADAQSLIEYLNKNYFNGVEQNYKLCQLTQDSAFVWQSFVFSERSKSTLLSSALKARSTESLGGIAPELLEQENQLQKNIATWRKRSTDAVRARDRANIVAYQDSLVAALRQYELFNKQLQKTTPQYYQLKYQRDIAQTTLQELRRKLNLQPNTVLLEYFIHHHKIYVYQLYHDSFKVKVVSIRHDTLNNAIAEFSKTLQNPSMIQSKPQAAYQTIAKRGHQLYTLLIDSLQIPNHIQRLIIVPDGKINDIPFETLLQKPALGNDMNYKKLDYLLNRYTITYAYSADLLAHNLAQKSVASRSVAAFVASYQSSDAVPLLKRNDTKRKNLSPLNFTMQELEHLQKLFPDGDFYAGQAANEKQFKTTVASKSPHHILHFAMHGLVDEKYPLGSSLAFTATGDTTEDDFLYLYEITHEQIQSDLVVLSACETGFGKFQNGEGVMSLARSFMYAGTPSVVMTLWAINDQTTPMIMEQFYNHLANGMPKDEALRQAKLHYLKNSEGLGAHPAFWAAFIHNGNYLPIRFGHPSALLGWAIGGGGLLVLLGGFWFWKQKTTLS